MATFIMLNPSTADAEVDDPTIRRCIGFAKAWELDGLRVLNLFALRATNPKELYEATDPVGPHNRDAFEDLRMNSTQFDKVVCAWGTHGGFKGQDKVVMGWLDSILLPYGNGAQALGITKGGFPKHPLYLPATATLDALTRATNHQEG